MPIPHVKVGDIVFYSREHNGVMLQLEAEVIYVDNSNIKLKHGNIYRAYWGQETQTYPSAFWYRIKLKERPSSKDKVSQKIKLLWNNSNWVKKNPLQAITA